MRRWIELVLLLLAASAFGYAPVPQFVFQFDATHRLVSLTRPAIRQTTTFGYDSIGNITSNGENGGGAYGYGIRMPHAVKSANGWNYAYDADGNMLVRANERLAYDPENRLVLVASTNLVVTFGYDAGGARLWKQGTNSNLHVWIGNNYEEKDGLTLFHVLANGQTVCTFDKNLTNVFVYYHPDNLHSTAIETDTNGNKVEHYEYMAYGQDRVTENPAAFPVSRRFTGQVKDQDTGLYYYGARYYDPVLGRFIQPDTIIPNLFDPQSLDRYAYARDNPLTYTDPTGHAPWYYYFPGIGAGAVSVGGQWALNAQAQRAGYSSYAAAARTMNIGGRVQTAGNVEAIQGAAQIAGGAANLYITAAQEIGTGGIGTAATAFTKVEQATVRSAEENTGETAAENLTQGASGASQASTAPQYYIENGVRRAVASREAGESDIPATVYREGEPPVNSRINLDQLHSPKSEIPNDPRFTNIKPPIKTPIQVQPKGIPGQLPAVPIKDVKIIPPPTSQ